MALNECADCTTAFAVGLPRCPHCRSTDFAEQGQDMPKITEHGGATNARAEVTLNGGVRMAGEWEPEPPPVDNPDEQTEGSEPSSAGSSSQTSSETPPNKPEPSEPDPPKPARATASRSRKARTGSSTASGTATSGPATATSPDPEN